MCSVSAVHCLLFTGGNRTESIELVPVMITVGSVAYWILSVIYVAGTGGHPRRYRHVV